MSSNISMIYLSLKGNGIESTVQVKFVWLFTIETIYAHFCPFYDKNPLAMGLHPRPQHNSYQGKGYLVATGGNRSCEDCEAGKFRTGSCPVGTACPCLECDDGWVQTLEGQSSCVKCEAVSWLLKFGMPSG